MTTTIKISETGEVRELECVIDGQDILADVMAGCGESVEVEDADFLVDTAKDAEWWAEWARIEELVHAAYAEADEAVRAEDEQLSIDWGHDMEELHLRECALYGIEA